MDVFNQQVQDLKQVQLDELLRIGAPATYLVKVTGDSMQGAGIYDGDLLIVDREPDPKHGDVVIACINGGAMCKRLVIEDGVPSLHSENPRYQPRLLVEGDAFEVWGVVKHSIRDHVQRK
ncbi:S24 family peptidase [Pseudomonas sp. RP23018S]|uniref:LexA family protein n=1 Tax=Pseudomonas sp. RP23018S TaxID=3096037 RepID=UPI002ACAE42F|nr:S24 family peptidase [Pseudomonas sp. RP23018S]MDZ5602620.1 S24 family peptidase [Pseudomonas sp. RP23018S]